MILVIAVDQFYEQILITMKSCNYLGRDGVLAVCCGLGIAATEAAATRFGAPRYAVAFAAGMLVFGAACWRYRRSFQHRAAKAPEHAVPECTGERELTNASLELLSLATTLLGTADPALMLRELFELIAGRFGLDAYFNFMLSERGDALRLDSYGGIPETMARGLSRLEFGQAVCGTVAANRGVIYVCNIQNSDDPAVQLIKGFGIRAYVCHPLVMGDRLIGTLSYGSRRRDSFSQEELTFFKIISHYVAIAKERARGEQMLHDAEKKKEEFLAMLAHELRNPMAAIDAAASLLTRPGINPEKTRFAAEALNRRVQQLARLVQDLLEVSNLIRGTIELHRENLEFSDVIHRAVAATSVLFHERRQTLHVKILDALPFYGDMLRLERILSNLLTNASKYSESGAEVTLSAHREEAFAVLRVKDHGIGIPRSAQSEIFTLFGQPGATIDRRYGGLGVGLTIVKRLTEMHGGTVTVFSEGAGKGSEFELRFPLCRSCEANTFTHAAEPWVPVGLRVLIVEDQEDTALMAALNLQLEGHRVEIARDGPSAVQRGLALRPDVILLDIGLPGVDGFKVARTLREQGLTSCLIVAVTGYGQESDYARSREAGIDYHLLKPLDYSRLLPLLAEYQQRQGEAELHFDA